MSVDWWTAQLILLLGSARSGQVLVDDECRTRVGKDGSLKSRDAWDMAMLLLMRGVTKLAGEDATEEIGENGSFRRVE